MAYDRGKFKEVLHYVINKVGGQSNVGKTVLYKLLYFSDFDFYELYEESFMGEKYRKIAMGPAPCHFEEVVEELKSEGKVSCPESEFHGRKQIKFVSLEEPDLNLLSARELKVLDDVMKKHGDLTAKKISEISHLDVPWIATDDGEIIDYRLVFYREPVTSVRKDER